MINNSKDLKNTNTLERFFLALINKQNRILFAALAAAVIAVLLLVKYKFLIYSCNSSNSDVWNNIIDPVITIATFVIGLLLGIYGLTNQWKNGLEKRLSVCFIFSPTEDMNAVNTNLLKDKIYLLSGCFESYLLNENDIRAFAQQIGAQINKGRTLKFLPFVKLGETKIFKKQFDDPARKSYYIKHYMFSIYMREIPEEITRLGKCVILDDNYDITPDNEQIEINVSEIKETAFSTYKGFRDFVEKNKL
jgi:hypothetical protein